MPTPASRRSGRPPRRRLVLAGTVLALGAGLAAVPTAAAAPTPGEAGYGDPYFPLDGNGGIDVLHYAVHDRYQFRGGRLSGSTTLTVRATQDLSSFHLDFLLPVRTVRVDGVPAAVSRPRRHEVRIEPATPITDGEEFRVRVAYAGRPGPIGYDGEKNWLADRREVVAMNQPHMAPWWFPSNDHPADKALMDISITVPRGMQVVANGNRVSRRVDGDLVTHHWRADEPMSTYLAMFAAGPFAVETSEVDGLPVRLLVSRQLPRRQFDSSLRMLRKTPAVLAALEDDLGAYPFSSAGGLVTGLPVHFALENQTMPTYFAVTGERNDWLVVHEQAHQWFGDSVAVERWRDIWLNEGAASFMEVRYAERQGRRPAAAWLRDAYDGIDPDSSFWQLEIAAPGARRIFAPPIYRRGAMTFQALRNRIGEEDFWELLRTWVEVHRDGNASTEDFVALAEDVSGEQLDGFFDAWLHTGLKPADTEANGLG